jgi:hypothetical protein
VFEGTLAWVANTTLVAISVFVAAVLEMVEKKPILARMKFTGCGLSVLDVVA